MGPASVKSRALLVAGYQGAASSLRLGEVDTPALRTGEVLVRVTASPINPNDLLALRNDYEIVKPVGTPAGFEATGVVVAGRGVLGRILVGRRVSFVAKEGSGSWAEHAVAKATQCVPLSRRVSDDSAATMLTNPLTARVLVRMAQREGHAAIVNGASAGALGQMIVQFAAELRLPVIALVRGQAQVERLLALGHKDVLDISDADFPDRLGTRCREKRATLALDPIGGRLTGQLLTGLLDGGIVRVYGAMSGAPCEVPTHELIFHHKRVVGFTLYDWLSTTGRMRQLLALREVQARLGTSFATRVSGRFGLEAFAEALALSAGAAQGGKVLFTPAQSPQLRQSTTSTPSNGSK